LSNNGWIGVDLDRTLAQHDYWRGPEHIGAPVPRMLARVKQWLSEGRDVRIFTERVYGGTVALSMGNTDGEQCRNVDRVKSFIEAWCQKHVGRALPITCQKDYGMIELWDDRCVQVIPNTGRTLSLSWGPIASHLLYTQPGGMEYGIANARLAGRPIEFRSLNKQTVAA
jgi:hypothetical protein